MKLDTAYFQMIVRKAERYDAAKDILATIPGYLNIERRNALRALFGLELEYEGTAKDENGVPVADL